MEIPFNRPYIGQAWESVSPFKGLFALILTLYSFFIFISRKHWDILLFSGGSISTYLFIVSYLGAMTASKFIMVLPWFVWTIGIALAEKGESEAPQLQSGESKRKD